MIEITLKDSVEIWLHSHSSTTATIDELPHRIVELLSAAQIVNEGNFVAKAAQIWPFIQPCICGVSHLLIDEVFHYYNFCRLINLINSSPLIVFSILLSLNLFIRIDRKFLKKQKFALHSIKYGKN